MNKMLDARKQGLNSEDEVLLNKLKERLFSYKAHWVGMYGCQNWATKKGDRWRTDAFKLLCWRRLLRVSWTARRSNQSISKEINPEYSLQGLMLKLMLQYFGHLTWTACSLEKTLLLVQTEDRDRREWWSLRWLDGITHSMCMSLIVEDRKAWHAAVHGVAKSWTRLNNRTELMLFFRHTVSSYFM